jgi:enoyl-CoA hydratase/carnithine racemase
MEKILLDIQNRIATITINNPEKMNCLDMEMLALIEKILTDIKRSKSAHVIVVKGAGDRAFSTGGNLNDFGKLTEFHEVKDWIKYGNEVFNLLASMPMATVASINGYAMGGGLELAMSCDLRIAAEDAVFSMPELNHGWVPGWGGLTRLRQIIGEARAKELIMLGERIDGCEAHRIGLVHKVCSKARLVEMTHDIALRLSKIDPFVLEMSKSAIMDHQRTTTANDLIYDALATFYSKK